MKKSAFVIIVGLALAAAGAEDPFSKAPEESRTPLTVLKILDLKEGPGLHPDLASEFRKIREIERRCSVALQEGTAFQRRNAIEIIRLYNLKSLAPALMDMINLKADMIYVSGNPSDLAESAEYIYPCYAVLKGWVDAALTKKVREKLANLGDKDTPEDNGKRNLLKMLMDLSE